MYFVNKSESLKMKAGMTIFFSKSNPSPPIFNDNDNSSMAVEATHGDNHRDIADI